MTQNELLRLLIVCDELPPSLAGISASRVKDIAFGDIATNAITCGLHLLLDGGYLRRDVDDKLLISWRGKVSAAVIKNACRVLSDDDFNMITHELDFESALNVLQVSTYNYMNGKVQYAQHS